MQIVQIKMTRSIMCCLIMIYAVFKLTHYQSWDFIDYTSIALIFHHYLDHYLLVYNIWKVFQTDLLLNTAAGISDALLRNAFFRKVVLLYMVR